MSRVARNRRYSKNHFIGDQDTQRKWAGHDTLSLRSVAVLNPFTPEFHNDPYAVYREYRAREPVHWGKPTSPSEDGAWYLMRYADIAPIVKDPRFTKNAPEEIERGTEPRALDQSKGGQLPFGQATVLQKMLRNWMVLRDPPVHTRLRNAVSKSFMLSLDEQLPIRIQKIADELLSRVEHADTFDLVRDFAVPLPIIVIAELLGVPTNNVHLIHAWGKVFFDSLDLKASTKHYQGGIEAAIETERFLKDLITQRRRAPQNDIISSLLAVEDKALKLNDEELVASCALLLFAGHETTVSMIGNAVLTLQHHRSQWEALGNEPRLFATAVEEILRYESAVHMATRFATCDTTVGGKTIRKGQQLCLVLAAGNRDPEQFENPEQVDVTRSPNRHLTFSQGIHSCLGAALARRQINIALQTLIRKMPNLRLQSDTPLWNDSIILRSLKSLHVSPSGLYHQ